LLSYDLLTKTCFDVVFWGEDMVEMTGEERKVADFLTEKKFKLEFQPSVSVQDLGGRTRLFNPDFYLSDLGIYIEVCGAERTEKYERTKLIYKKNKIPIIFVETYKEEGKWKYHLIQSISRIHEKRQKVVSTIQPSQTKVEGEINFGEVKEEISNHINDIETQKVNEDPTPIIPPSNVVYYKNQVISNQSLIGIALVLFGILFFILAIVLVWLHILIFFIFGTVGLLLFYLGLKIVSYRFSRWFDNWIKATREKIKATKDTFDKWLRK
jgi:hypothetical protein